MSDATPDQPSYEEAREELIEVVRTLEAGGTTLEESLALWERGEALAKVCQQWLDGARKRLDVGVNPTGADRAYRFIAGNDTSNRSSRSRAVSTPRSASTATANLGVSSFWTSTWRSPTTGPARRRRSHSGNSQIPTFLLHKTG